MSHFSIPSLFLILCCTFVYGINTEPVITLNGPNPQYVDSGGVYEELGAVAYDDEDGSLTDQIVISGSVNTNYPGNYTIQYVVTDSDGNSTVMNRTVTVTDQTPPVIILQGNSTVSVEVFNSYTELGAIATDEYDGDLSSSIIIAGTVNTSIVGAYQIVYSVTDSHGNTASVTRTVVVIDSTPPVINLNGATTIYLELGSTYIDPGASATDEYDGDLTSSIIISGTVDTSNVGTYYIYYNATDSSGNVANQKVRTVIIEDIYPSLEIIITAIIYDDDVDGYNGLGDTIEYTIAVENTGNINLSDVYITDNLTALNGDSLSLTTGPTFISNSSSSTEGTLQPGETATYIATYVISQQAVDSGGVTISAHAAAVVNENTTVEGSTDSPVVTTLGMTPSIQVTKTAAIADDGDGIVGIGDIIQYTINIENTGNVTLSSLSLIDTLTDLNDNPLSLSSDPIFTGSSLNSAEGTLQVGENATYQASFTIDQQAANAGGVSNIASIIASTPNQIDNVSAESNNVITLIGCLTPLNPGAQNQSVCEGNPITPIEYTVGNDVSGVNLTWTKDGVSISGNPPGIGYYLDLGQLVFEGAPSENIPATTTYSYDVQTSGGLCGSGNANGTIVVHPAPKMFPISGPVNQVVCEGESISNIVFDLVNGSDMVEWSWDVDPLGIYGQVDPNTSQFILSGTPLSVDQDTVHNYTLLATNSFNGCVSESITGSITVLKQHSLNIIQGSGVLCNGKESDSILFEISGGASSAEVDGLPTGIIWSISDNIINISGTPDVDILEPTYYISTITTYGNNCVQITYDFEILINPSTQCVEEGKILLNGPVEVNDGTLYIKKEDGLILYSSFDDQCYRIKVHTGQVIADPVNCD